MPYILVTGGTGFLGGALAGTFLANGKKVICLSRNDPDGERTLLNIKEAMHGFGHTATTSVLENLQIENIDTEDFAKELDRFSFWEDIDEIWHCAADMNYSLQNVANSYEHNVRNSVLLYQKFSEHRSPRKRFYYMSTAFVGGNVGADVKEELHLAPVLTTSYQITKFAAENTLFLASQHGNPLTILRPSVVIGHRKTGWFNYKPYGLYMFARGFFNLAKMTSQIRLAIPPEAAINLVPIDTVIEQAYLLSQQETHRQHHEVFHLVSDQNVNSRALLTAIAEEIGLTLIYENAQSLLERRLEQSIEANRVYATQAWNFHNYKLHSLLSEHEEAFTSVNLGSITSVVRKYYTHLKTEKKKKASTRRRTNHPIQQVRQKDMTLAI